MATNFPKLDIPKDILKTNNLKAIFVLAANWLIIITTFLLVAWYPNLFTYLLALLLLGGRQLGLAVLMHECGHNTFFKLKPLNQWLGQWLCAYPVFQNLNQYAQGHLRHHQKAGTEEDPDLSNYKSYPVSKMSLGRKFGRDLAGITGIKYFLLFFSGKANLLSRSNHKIQWQPLLVNSILFSILFFFNHGELYLLWLLAFVTTFMLFSRIRQIAEHAAIPDRLSPDPRLHTRTTYANWFERLLVAPNFVNFHTEHHICPAIPCYNLKKFHQWLQSKSLFAVHPPEKSYLQVLKHVVS